MVGYLATVIPPQRSLKQIELHSLSCSFGFRDFQDEICIDGRLHRLPAFQYFHEDTDSYEAVLEKARQALRMAGFPTARIVLARVSGAWTDQIVA